MMATKRTDQTQQALLSGALYILANRSIRDVRTKLEHACHDTMSASPCGIADSLRSDTVPWQSTMSGEYASLRAPYVSSGRLARSAPRTFRRGGTIHFHWRGAVRRTPLDRTPGSQVTPAGAPSRRVSHLSAAGR